MFVLSKSQLAIDYPLLVEGTTKQSGRVIRILGYGIMNEVEKADWELLKKQYETIRLKLECGELIECEKKDSLINDTALNDTMEATTTKQNKTMDKNIKKIK